MTTFQDVYDEYHTRIHHYLGKIAGNREAEDLTQEVFLKIDKGLNDFKGKSSLSTWVYRIATNVALDRLRSRSFRQKSREIPMREEEEDSDIDLVQGTGESRKVPSVVEKVIREEMDECILEFVDRLPLNYRTVVILSELKELKYKEIAEILDVSLETVKIRMYRARQRLKKEFQSGCTLYHDGEGGLSCDRK